MARKDLSLVRKIYTWNNEVIVFELKVIQIAINDCTNFQCVDIRITEIIIPQKIVISFRQSRVTKNACVSTKKSRANFWTEEPSYTQVEISQKFHSFEICHVWIHAFFYKNTLYKNVQDEIDQKVKDVLRILPSCQLKMIFFCWMLTTDYKFN